jgi:hypothetical protein
MVEAHPELPWLSGERINWQVSEDIGKCFDLLPITRKHLLGLIVHYDLLGYPMQGSIDASIGETE